MPGRRHALISGKHPPRLFLVSHYKNTLNGYTLEFTGGTALIYDPVQPGLSNVTVNCNASSLKIKLNKKLMCSSLASNGSDFSISSATVGIISATGDGCSS